MQALDTARLEAIVEFRVLGPVEVIAGGQRIDVGHARQRAVLAILVLELSQVVPAERIIARVWADDPPDSVRNVLSGYVAKLRSALIRNADPAVSLSRKAGGYVLEANKDDVDLHRFRRLVAEAGVAGDDERAALLMGEALGLWRGEALAALASPWAAAMRETLAWEKLAVQLDLNDIRLRQGQHHLLLADLGEQSAAYPLDERLIGQLMLGLYRSGRQAEALRRFEHTREMLADELGASPGRELQSLHQRILRGDESLSLPESSRRSDPIPRQLPPDVADFTGRTAELAELDRLLGGSADGVPSSGDGVGLFGGAGSARSVVISALSGTAGVGKTATAVRWAHQIADRFPDGQLYVNLRGFESGEPVQSTDVLAAFLRALGVPGPDIPADADERAARYRTHLAGRRMLILLDNAREAEQVRPMLPSAPGCLALVTSRDAMVGLVARDGARRLQLDLLPLADAVSLLRSLIGSRVDSESEAAAALAILCARLPLALRVAAELAAARPAAPMADLLAELADRQRRLDLLDAAGDPRTAVRAVFSWSIRNLDPRTARAFRLLGLHPGPDLDACAVAALAGTSLKHARHLLDQLAGAHLIQAAGPGRYAMHDLLRDYACELAAAEDGEEGQQAALTRLFDYYLHGAAAAMDILYPAEQHLRPRIQAPVTIAPALIEPDTARTWLAADRACLVHVAAHAATRGWPGHAINLAGTLSRYLDAGGYFPEAATLHEFARSAAQLTGDLAAEAAALSRLAMTEHQQGHYERAARHLEQALPLSRQIGDRDGEARAQSILGALAVRQGHYSQAAGHLQLAMNLCRETGNRIGEAIVLGNLGETEVRLGRFQQAADHLQQALALSRDTGDQAVEAYALMNLGSVNTRQGRYEQAGPYLERSLALCRDTCHRLGEASALVNLGEFELRQGHCQDAAGHLKQALALSHEAGSRSEEADALNKLGEVSFAIGEYGHARIQHADALALASQIGDHYQQACAHDGLARAHQADADLEQARDHWQRALALYAELGTPEADQIRIQLAAGATQGQQMP